ncbi:MAG: hypothetical protein JO091_10135, partial [Acidobacteriaceae bacterium]|nr:hypothetical protein [Acidobacteriaceae bacterium]
MAVTKSWDSSLALAIEVAETVRTPERRRELLWLGGASLLAACGLAFVLMTKTQDFANLESRLNRGELLNLNAVTAPQQLLPALQIYPSAEERDQVAQRIAAFVQQHRPLPNIGALARLHLPLGKLKPLFVVRTPREFLHIYAFWAAAYIAA